MNDILQSLSASLHNQFLSGGLILMLTGAAMALMRQVPRDLWFHLKKQFSIQIDVLDSDPAFDWITTWLDQHPYTKKSRTLSVSSVIESEDENPLSRARVVFSPAPGKHYFRYGKRFIRLERNRSDPTQQKGTSGVFRREESYTITILGRKQAIARDLILEAMMAAKATYETRTHVFISMMGWWRRMNSYTLRPLSSVILPEGTAELFRDDLLQFLRSRKWYQECGIPYHRGYLLHGVPGSGKTSLVAGIAHDLKMNLHVLNIGAPGMSDERLLELIMDVRPRSILLIEDIDAATVNRVAVAKPDAEGEQKQGVTLSGLLNCLDGVVAKDGCVICMTTNHRDRLDPALLRPGRVDLQIEFDYADSRQIERLYQRMSAEPSERELRQLLASLPAKVTMAEVQQRLMEEREMVGLLKS